jgi:UDP-galactopyranose mutase
LGRNGLHHYDNQDHAMLSAMKSVAGYFGEDIDPWRVNTDMRYQESGLLTM